MRAAALVVFTLLSLQPQQPAPTGLIVGRVVDGSSGRPIGGAIVSLVGGALVPNSALPVSLSGGPRAITNANGQFVFRKLVKGSYLVQTTRTGYVDGASGRRRPGGSSTTLQLDEGQRIGDLVIPMWKFAAISGTVVDEAGEPLIGVQVRAFQRRIVAGRRRVAAGPTAFTDDRGVYRIPNLTPGEYLVAFVWREVSMPMSVWEVQAKSGPGDPRAAQIGRESIPFGTVWSPGSPQGVLVGNVLRELDASAPTPPGVADEAATLIYPTQFFPGVPSAARATTVTLASGQERQNVDFALRPARTARVSGTLLGPDGPAAFVALRLVPPSDDATEELETAVTMTGPAGEFTFLGVPAGQYTIKALRVPRVPAAVVTDDPTMFADAAVAVADRDVNDVVVTLQRAARVTGRFEFDGTIDRPDGTALARVPITLDRVDTAPPTYPLSTPPPGRGDQSGAFKTYGMAPGKYIIRVGGVPSGWTLKSVMSGGRDISEQPVDLRTADVTDVVITYTDRSTKLTGVVRGSDGKVDSAALVIVFPADSAAWSDYGLNPRRVRSTRSATTGAFTVSGLPPGEYHLAAIHEEAFPEWQDPVVLEELSRRATQIRLGEGETRAQDLKTIDRGGR